MKAFFGVSSDERHGSKYFIYLYLCIIYPNVEGGKGHPLNEHDLRLGRWVPAWLNYEHIESLILSIALSKLVLEV